MTDVRCVNHPGRSGVRMVDGPAGFPVWVCGQCDGIEVEPAPVPTFTRPGRRTGRNDPCPCGSGEKAKRCCGTKR